MFSLVGIQAKLAALGAALLVVLSFFVRLKIVTSQRDRATKVAAVLKSRNNVIVEQRKIKREEEATLLKELASIEEELKKPEEEFKGVENFNDPNDF